MPFIMRRAGSAVLLAAAGISIILGMTLLIYRVIGSEARGESQRVAASSELFDNFNHDATSFPLLGAHKRLNCSQCHLGGQYKGVPNTCETCHNGQVAYGRPSNHVMTTQRCDECHTVSAWSPAVFRHDASATGQCSTCHNGQKATGKPSNHITTTSQCDTCHKTTGWVPATYIHDASATGQCSTCHNGQKATGKPSNHITTTSQCDTCHKTTGWVPAIYIHDASATGQCSTCHNSQKATGKPQGHLVTTLQCDTCHKTIGWIPATLVNHDNPKLIGAHSVLPCSACHPQTVPAALFRDGTQYGFCANCHTRDYKYPGPDAHKINPATKQPFTSMADSLQANAMCANCHRHADYKQF